MTTANGTDVFAKPETKVYAAEVIAAEKELSRAAHLLSNAYDRSETGDSIATLRAIANAKQTNLSMQIALLRTTGALEGVRTESGSVVRAYEIAAEVTPMGATAAVLSVQELREEQAGLAVDRDEFGHGLGEIDGGGE